jgi:ribosomal protein S18 acetylase RimI-like enzyme
MPAALQPMFRTYQALANQIGTTWQAGEGFWLAQSDIPHPLLNFAFAGHLTAYSARELADAIRTPITNIFCLNEPTLSPELLRRNGASESFEMLNLVGTAVAGDGPVQEPEWIAPDQRREVADFMVSQFFRRQDIGYQAQFSRALTEATSLRLAVRTDQGRLAAAVLVSPDVPGERIGIFNLCTDSSFRNQGHGTQLLRTILAAHQARQGSIQCVPELALWYKKRGFDGSETVRAFRISA